jgi:hypothetical protein
MRNPPVMLKARHTVSQYVVKQAYWLSDMGEIEIQSEDLLYVENGKTHHGVQCRNLANQDEILKRCKLIADTFREIEELNRTP